MQNFANIIPKNYAPSLTRNYRSAIHSNQVFPGRFSGTFNLSWKSSHAASMPRCNRERRYCGAPGAISSGSRKARYLPDNSTETGMAFERLFCYKRRVRFGSGIRHLPSTELETSWRLGHEFRGSPQRCEARSSVHTWAKPCPIFNSKFSPYILGELHVINAQAGFRGLS